MRSLNIPDEAHAKKLTRHRNTEGGSCGQRTGVSSIRRAGSHDCRWQSGAISRAER